MSFWQRFLGHLKTVTKHRFWVFYFCCKAGIPFRGLVHDLSKFNPVEFIEGVRYYQGTRSPIDYCKEVNGYSMSWLHHKGRNPNHYEYWQDDFDHGGKPLKMPYKYAIELVCDYLAAGRAYMGKNFTYDAEYEWWLKKSSNPIAMHTHTKLFVDCMLSTMMESKSCNCLKKKESLALYNLVDAQGR